MFNKVIHPLLIILLFSTSLMAKEERGEFYLKNGTKVIYRRIEANKIGSLNLFVRGGCLNLTKETMGLEALTLKLMLRGSKRYPKERLEKELSQMGTRFNASSGYDYSYLNMTCLSRYFDRSLDIFSDCILNPLFDAQELSLLQGKLIADLKRKYADPDEMVWYKANETLMRDHPYINYQEGSPQTIEGFNQDDLFRYKGKVIKTGQVFLVYVGDLSQGDLDKELNRAFGAIPRGDYSLPPIPPFEDRTNQIIVAEKPGLTTAYIAGKFPAPSPSDPDFPALQIAMRLLSTNLDLSLRTKHALTYATWSFATSYRRPWGGVYISTAKPNEAIKLIYSEIDKMKKEPPPQEELRNQITRYITLFYYRNETAESQAQNLGAAEFSYGDWSYHYRWVDDLKKVSPQDVLRMMGKYFTHLKLGVYTDSEKMPIQKDLFLSFGG